MFHRTIVLGGLGGGRLIHKPETPLRPHATLNCYCSTQHCIGLSKAYNVSSFSVRKHSGTVSMLFCFVTPPLRSKMETVCFSETSVSTYKTARRHNPEEQHRHLHRRENLKSHILGLQFPFRHAADGETKPFCSNYVTNRQKGVKLCDWHNRRDEMDHSKSA
jgi:hypothetical protein